MGKDEKNAGGTMDQPFVRSAYYPGKLLRASDFVREQEYGKRRLEFVNRKFHGRGIIEGLRLRTGQDGSLFLSHGSALDPCGRMVVVPEDRQVKPEEIEGLRPEAMRDFILAIQYAERTVETEPEVLEENRRQPSRIEESYVLKAVEETEFWRLKEENADREDFLTGERLLYESEAVTLAVRVPKTIPVNSVFKLRMRVRAKGEDRVRIGWHGIAKLQGALLVQSKEACFMLEEEQAVCSGSLQKEWEICTEENRELPVMVEISHLEVITDHAGTVEVPACQFTIDTVDSYEQTVKRYLQEREKPEPEAEWLPLARLGLKEGSGENKYAFFLREEDSIRSLAVCPGEEELLRRIAEENGILDLWWRRLLPDRPLPPLPVPDRPLPPVPPGSGGAVPVPREEFLTEAQVRGLLGADREERIRRGVAVIQVPKRYRKKQVLFSEEISYGFPGEEVLLWCGRVREEPSYLYWKRGEKQYRVFYGEEGLFPDGREGLEVRRQAVMQNVENGTFRIALTLAGRGRKNRSREVAISWTAIKIF